MISPDNNDAFRYPKILNNGNDAAAVISTPVRPLNNTQTNCTGHMVVWQWDELIGWESPEIRPYGPLAILPIASVLQYATECFEGVKIYRGYDDRLRVFRLHLNCERMLKSSLRVGLPEFDPAHFEAILTQFGALEAERWLPRGQVGQTLYLRPTHIGTTAALGVQRPRQSLLYVIATLSPGFPTKGNGMRLLTSPTDIVRAWPGGFGNRKLGGNYGPTLPIHDAALQSGFDQVLWLFGPEGFVTEAGASNFFVVWKTKKGDVELVTAGLENGTILEGITRYSVLDLVRSNNGVSSAWQYHGHSLPPLTAVERDFSINEIKDAVDDGRLIEAFAVGTAYFIAPVGVIQHRGSDMPIPIPTTGSASYALLIKGWLSDIVFGVQDPHKWTKEIALS
ncbi:branched-chain-amino-acid aminotransferase, mitochondrial precursor [Trichoderma arundinaceum]|uniref:Branched-chain-amino-acid aminotransferase n=1 Tax=Trichoderma arundinaceum TaxID=490622 RepID=A0A395NQK3_TRIAR|nr:branched-chain-amino-acid aminotransferase, mitochondrial precursor [Trichoderma arundinaceum]